MSMHDLPESLHPVVERIRRLRSRKFHNAHEKAVLDDCCLEVAIWVCRSEGLTINGRNLGAVLGEDGPRVLARVATQPRDYLAGRVRRNAMLHPLTPAPAKASA